MTVTEQTGRVELRRRRSPLLTKERVKTGVLACVFLALLWLMVDMGRDFMAVLEDKPRRTLLFDKPGDGRPGPGEEPAPERALAEDGRGQAGGGKAGGWVYFVTRGSPPALLPLPVAPTGAKDLKSRISAIVDRLQGPPPSDELLSPLPEGTKLLAVFKRGNHLYVDLSPEVYGKHSGDTLLCYASLQALVNSICSQTGVAAVKVLVSNKERLTLKGHFDLMKFWTFDNTLVEQRGRTDEHD